MQGLAGPLLTRMMDWMEWRVLSIADGAGGLEVWVEQSTRQDRYEVFQMVYDEYPGWVSTSFYGPSIAQAVDIGGIYGTAQPTMHGNLAFKLREALRYIFVAVAQDTFDWVVLPLHYRHSHSLDNEAMRDRRRAHYRSLFLSDDYLISLGLDITDIPIGPLGTKGH